MSEHDKEHDFLSKFILHEVFVTGTVDEIHLFVIPENEVELLTNAWPWAPVEFAKQHLILLLETVKFWGIDLLKDVDIETESELEGLETKGCSKLFNFRKLLSKEEKLSAIISKVEDLLTLGLLCTFKSSAKLGKIFKPCFQKWCIEQAARFLLSLHFFEVTNLRFSFTLFISQQKISGT